MNTINAQAAAWAMDNAAYMAKPMRLLGSSQKVEKGSDKRETYILYLQPATKVATSTLCIGAAAAGCESPCLISSGKLGITTGQKAATKRTILYLTQYEAFKAQLLREIDKAEKRALKTGIPALFRLNGTSDIDFSDIISARPNSQFYDYTKVLSRVRSNTLANYHLTYSGSMYSEQSRAALGKAVSRGYNIAIAVNAKRVEDIIATDGLVSFDTTDLRPMDAKGSIGYLTRKGSSKAKRALEGEKSFFVTEHNVASFYKLVRRTA